jgi:hypothetical protein
MSIAITLDRFRTLTRRYALFHTLFFSFFLLELLSLLIFLPFLAKSFLLALLIATTVLSAFAYYVLRFYFQTKKPEQFHVIKEEFTNQAPSLEAIYQLIEHLDGQEHQYYSLPNFLKTLAPLIQKFSVWCHWEDVHRMKELLHTFGIHKVIEQIKRHPIDLELHRSLANSYTALYKIYQAPSQPNFPFLAKAYASEEMRAKFHRYAECAIEELKILIHYLPHDQEALSKLGSIYHDLDHKEEEQAIYELLLQLFPQASAIRFRLGVLYFRLGKMAQGLKMYDDLHRLSDPKAEELIQYYDLVHLFA